MFTRPQLDTLYRYCCALTQNGDTAYDLLQNSLVAFLGQEHSHIQTPTAYMRRIIRNGFIDTLRGRTRVEFLGSEDVSALEIAAPVSSLESLAITRQALDNLWGRLSPSERELLYLWAVEGYTMAELSKHMDVPRGTLLSRVHRLRKRIQAETDEHGTQGVTQ